MTEQEAEDFFLEINAIFRRHELAWLANEITGEAAEGQASPKMLIVQEYAEPPVADGIASRPKRRKTNVATECMRRRRANQSSSQLLVGIFVGTR